MKKLMLFALLLFGISLFSSNHTMAAESRITVPFEKEMKINWNWNDFKKSSIKGPSTNLAIAGLILSSIHTIVKIKRTIPECRSE